MKTGPLRDVLLFVALACGITWLLDAPLAFAWATGRVPSPLAMPLVALGAFGPTLAALAIAWRRRELAGVFGRWRAPLGWIALSLFVPLLVQLPATLIEVALGGHPAHWFYPPTRPEHFAALVIFSFGEEFGWRGFAYPRLERRFGPVLGSLVLGSGWGLWHLGMMFAPDPLRALPISTLFVYIVELALWSVVMAWVFERGNRSMAVAIALHAGAHIDNVSRAPESEIRLRVLRVAMLAAVAMIAARSLAKRQRSSSAPDATDAIRRRGGSRVAEPRARDAR